MIYKNLLKQKNYSELKKLLNEENPADLAEFFEELSEEKKLFVFRLLTKDTAAETFSYMDSGTKEQIVKAVTDNEVREIVDEMFLDDTVDFLNELPANLVTKVLKNTDESKRVFINKFLNYPENSAGSLMTIEFVQFHETTSVGEAMKLIKKTGVDKETIYTCYIINSSRVLVGIVPLRILILSSDDTIVKDIMESKVISVHTLDDQEEIASIFKKYNLISLPVVDNENRLVGIITVDDIVDVIEDEDTEDFEKMAGLLPSDEQYLKTGVFKLAKHRIVWLLLLMISGTLSGAIINGYEYVLSSAVILTAFIPILTDTGGNAGSQASTLVIRGMAIDEISPKDIFKVLKKEIGVGLICGIILAAVNYLRLMVINHVEPNVNITISLTMFLIVVCAKALGAILPMGAKAIKIDPAMMAGPLISTILDSLSLLIYFQIAKIFVLK